MREEVLAFAPIGAPIEAARTVMETHGFECTTVLSKESGKPHLFCEASRTVNWPVVRRWMVSIDFNEGKVVDVRVESGLVGP